MIRRSGWSLVVWCLGAWAGAVLADQFEQLDGPTLARTIKSREAQSKQDLTIAEIGAMPALLRDTRSALVLATTDRGNPARLLLVPEFRKPTDAKGEPIPVIVLERLDTFDASEISVRLTTRRDLVVYDGFQVDLDSGQVVPDGQGGDVVFRVGGEGGPRLDTIGAAKLYTLSKAPTFDTTKAPQPTPGKAVLPGDFAGRYRLFANGLWSGTLDLKVEGRGVVTGQFRSDLHGTTYQVSGQVANDVAHKILFAIKYPRARQEFEGYLWAEGKGAMAGVASIAERPVGFFAIREGGKIAPEEAILGVLDFGKTDKSARHVVQVSGERLTLDGKFVSLDELSAAIKVLVETEVTVLPWVMIRVAADQKYGDLIRVVEAIQNTGVRTLRFEPVEAGE